MLVEVKTLGRRLDWTMLRAVVFCSGMLFGLGFGVGGLPASEGESEIILPVETKSYSLTVVDEQGKPLSGIHVQAAGVRCEEDPGSWYGWPTYNVGSDNKKVTDELGRITVEYPVKFGQTTELVTTNKIDFRFLHPAYVASSVEVDPREEGIEHTLVAGCPVLFSAVDDNGSPVEEFGVLMAGQGGQAEWVLAAGEARSRGIPDGAWQTMLAAPGSDGKTLFSGILPTRFAKGRPVTIRSIKLTPGIQLAGQLADVVPRPVTHGRVIAYCLPKPQGRVYEDKDPSLPWCEVVDIASDGSFVFPSLPRTGTVQLIALCRGWLIVSEPREGQQGNFLRGIQVDLDQRNTAEKSLSVELPMQLAGSIEVLVSKPDGTPLADAQVSTWPNQAFDKGGSTIIGMGFPSMLLIEKQISGNGAGFAEVNFQEHLKSSPYSAVTDEQGRAILYDIPIGQQQSLVVDHKEFKLKSTDQQQHAFASLNYTLADSQRKTIEVATELMLRE